jgi:hypothetical protein
MDRTFSGIPESSSSSADRGFCVGRVLGVVDARRIIPAGPEGIGP